MIGMDFVDQVRPGILELQCLRTVNRDESDLFEREFQSGMVGRLDRLGWLVGWAGLAGRAGKRGGPNRGPAGRAAPFRRGLPVARLTAFHPHP